MKELIAQCIDGNIEEAHVYLNSLWKDGYSANDIITTVFKVVKNYQMEEHLQLEFTKVITPSSKYMNIDG